MSDQAPILVYKHFLLCVLAYVNTVVHQACYGPDNMLNRDGKDTRFHCMSFS
jgi:hypothetical protein